MGNSRWSFLGGKAGVGVSVICEWGPVGRGAELNPAVCLEDTDRCSSWPKLGQALLNPHLNGASTFGASVSAFALPTFCKNLGQSVYPESLLSKSNHPQKSNQVSQVPSSLGQKLILLACLQQGSCLTRILQPCLCPRCFLCVIFHPLLASLNLLLDCESPVVVTIFEFAPRSLLRSLFPYWKSSLEKSVPIALTAVQLWVSLTVLGDSQARESLIAHDRIWLNFLDDILSRYRFLIKRVPQHKSPPKLGPAGDWKRGSLGFVKRSKRLFLGVQI